MLFKLIAAFVLSLLVGLVAHAPADKLIPLLLQQELGLRLYEVDGELLSGQAGYVEFRDLGARNLRWDVHLAQLLRLRLAADVEVSLDSKDPRRDNSWLTARLNKSLLSDRVELRDLEGVVPIEAMAKPLRLPFLPLGGNLYFRFDQLAAEGNRPVQASGLARLLSTEWRVGRSAPLGDFQASVSTDKGVIGAQFSGLDNARLDLDGQASLNPDGSYRAQARLRPKLDTPAPVANSMKALGRTDRQGWYSINQQGALP